MKWFNNVFHYLDSFQLHIGPQRKFEAKNLTPATKYSFRVLVSNGYKFISHFLISFYKWTLTWDKNKDFLSGFIWLTVKYHLATVQKELIIEGFELVSPIFQSWVLFYCQPSILGLMELCQILIIKSLV